MKKLLSVFLFSFVLVLSACGSDKPEAKREPKQDEIKKDEPVKKAKEKESDIYFDGKVAQIEMLKVEIKETKVIPVGEEGNEYGDKPVFAIWYDATNLSGEDIDPITAWLAIFTAIQDNDPNMVNELGVGSSPDEAHLDTQSNTIKKDGTVENSIAYELDDLETPVTLVATQGMLGDKIGEENYEIK
ncbi:DUF5067 domain-containing protein [Sporosarcina sp. G11-34]|uniref:DUF5067 domain-containing protein n=1 Tax=Sporosarcina sp. G11-34 TaxID=2849605 RepID=UPI0022A91EA3|nr:DUF5067 domain-containing protein [Sporosarcina sp. G11-34]